MKRLAGVLMALLKVCEEFKAGPEPSKDSIITASELVTKLGAKNEGINILEIERYLRSSHIARKISGYSDKTEAGGTSQGLIFVSIAP